MIKLNQVVRIEENLHNQERYFATSFPLANMPSNISHDKALSTNSQLESKLNSGRAAVFFRELAQIEGIGFSFQRYKITVKLEAALEWSQIEPVIFKLIREYYGSFSVKRESLLKRTMYALRRNVLEPLFPHWYSKTK